MPGRAQPNQLPRAYFLNTDSRQAVIPFTTVNNLIIIPVQLNNLVPLQFLLDTGVRTPLLTERLYSDLLQLEYNRKLSLRGAGNQEPVEAYMAPNVALRLPSVQMDREHLLVLQEDYLELSKQLGTPVHGIIGASVFERFIVKIDYDQREITLYDPQAFKRPRGFQQYQLLIEDSKPYLTAQVTGADSVSRELKMLLDTGASHALLLHNEQACIALPDSTIKGNLGRGLLGDIDGEIGRIPGMSMGKYQFSDVLVSFPEAEDYSVNSLELERDGTIGGEFLRRFITYIDYPNQKLYLKRARSYRDKFIFTKTGLSLEAEGDDLNQFVVTSVRENSPGEAAGILAGDYLIKVKGTQTKNLSLYEIQEYMRRKDGKKLKLILQRGTQQIKTQIVLQDML